jgi:hypothetical protein
MNKVLMLSVVSLLPVVGTAQVVTPVPPAAPAAPAWTPPPPPAPVTPPKPAVDPELDKDIPTPDVVKLDGEGHVIWPSLPPELMVFEAIPLDANQRQAWGEKWQARQAQLDAHLRRLGGAGQVGKLGAGGGAGAADQQELRAPAAA